MINQQVWDDQHEFNRQLRADPASYPERTAMTKEFMLHMISECSEVLDASGTWKMHRRTPTPENLAQIQSELIDVFKYWMSIAQIWGLTPHDLESAYWSKSAAVRQRYAEEWIHSLDRDLVVVDLDNVLADYVSGFADWINVHHPGSVSGLRLQEIKRRREWLTAESLECSHATWSFLKHAFRTHGGKRTLPVMRGAQEFLQWVHAQGWAIVVLTSRPIDRYPTIYEDTVAWFAANQLPVDYIWWGSNKATKLVDASTDERRDILSRIRFVVDDDPEFVRQYEKLGLKTYWVWTPAHALEIQGKNVHIVRGLAEIVQQEMVTWITQTPDTDRTLVSTGNPPLQASTSAPTD